WSMRWNPTNNEIGTWSGMTFSDAPALIAAKPHYVGPGYLHTAEVPDSLRPYLRNITRQNEPNTLPINAVIGRIPARSPWTVARIKRTLAIWQSAPATLQFKVCTGLGECMLLVVWRSEAESEAAVLMKVLQSKFPDAWAMRLNATDFEIGHWNNLRFREIGGAPSRAAN
ncbi:MAG: hypothetical protein CTY39_05550, partial [Hyphomicrobium sp.]